MHTLDDPGAVHYESQCGEQSVCDTQHDTQRDTQCDSYGFILAKWARLQQPASKTMGAVRRYLEGSTCWPRAARPPALYADCPPAHVHN